MTNQCTLLPLQRSEIFALYRRSHFFEPKWDRDNRISQNLEDSGDHYVRPYGRLGASRSSTSGSRAWLFHDSTNEIRRYFLYISQGRVDCDVGCTSSVSPKPGEASLDEQMIAGMRAARHFELHAHF